MIDAAERLLKEARSSISLSGLVHTITNKYTIESKNLLCDYESKSLLHYNDDYEYAFIPINGETVQGLEKELTSTLIIKILI